MTDSPARFLDLCLDAVDHQALADWWCAAMGYVRRDKADRGSTGPVLLVDPAGAGPAPLAEPGPGRHDGREPDAPRRHR